MGCCFHITDSNTNTSRVHTNNLYTTHNDITNNNNNYNNNNACNISNNYREEIIIGSFVSKNESNKRASFIGTINTDNNYYTNTNNILKQSASSPDVININTFNNQIGLFKKESKRSLFKNKEKNVNKINHISNPINMNTNNNVSVGLLENQNQFIKEFLVD